MLRSIAFKNLINFKERQELKFTDGVNFLIGANSTGKSSICELIRRCHSVHLSSSLTNLLNDDEPGYIVSKYEGCSDLLKDIYEENTELEVNAVFLCYFHQMEKETNTIYKCVCFNSKTDGEVYIAASQYGNNLEKVVRRFPLQKYKEPLMRDFINPSNTADDQRREQISQGEHTFLKTIKQIFEKPEDLEWRSGYTSEAILEKLKTTFACVFPVRSFGPMQWINGNNVRKLDASKNYRHAHTQAEILWNLLPQKSQGERRRNTWQDWMYYLWSILIYFYPGWKRKISSHEYEHIDETECLFFNRVTYPLEYEFKKIIEEGTIEVLHKNDPSPHPRSFELLKAPEGIIEAKQATLVLSHRKLKTICYEDIERCMHNQMIENMNNFVLKEMKEKTVIIVTHNPAFMNRWALERTHVCSRKTDSDKRFVNIVKKVREKDARKYGFNHEMRKVLFSARVLLVEGLTELNVLRSLFDYILCKKEKLALLEHFLNEGDQNKDDFAENVLRTFCLLQVISLGSKYEIARAETFCREVNIFVKVLSDNDDGNRVLKKHKFMWANGTIEDALRHDCPKNVAEILNIKDGIYTESKWKKSYKPTLKNKINEGLPNEKYDNLFDELFDKIENNEESEFLEFFEFIAE